MGYEPEVITKLSRRYTMLQDRYVNCWYGEAGADSNLAIMILEDKPMEELLAYCKEAGYLEEEEEEEE